MRKNIQQLLTNEKGFTLIELIIAFTTIFAIIFIFFKFIIWLFT
jgi:type II secretory pathway component PulJ